MVYVTRKPGETLVLETPGGKVVVQVLANNQLAIEAPAGVRVAGTTSADHTNWLPARPRLVHVA